MRGGTTLYGKVLEVGDTIATLRNVLTGEIHAVAVTEEHAAALSARHGDEVGIDVDATWDFPTLNIAAATMTRLLPYKRVSNRQAFEELRASVGGAFDGVDAEAWVRAQRSDD